MRVGELLDLELDCIVDFDSHGTWLRVPLGKLGTERMVPLDPETLACSTTGSPTAARNARCPIPAMATSPTSCSSNGADASAPTGSSLALTPLSPPPGSRDRAGNPLHVTLHQLRHTFGTSLVNAGMNLPALMALLGHVTPEMTLRYASLASPTIRDAYETAMTKVNGRRSLFTIPAGAHRAIPSKVDWLTPKCSRPASPTASAPATRSPAPAPTPTSANSATTSSPTPNEPTSSPAQRADVRALRDDAEQRGWTDEAARHDRVADALEPTSDRSIGPRP